MSKDIFCVTLLFVCISFLYLNDCLLPKKYYLCWLILKVIMRSLICWNLACILLLALNSFAQKHKERTEKDERHAEKHKDKTAGKISTSIFAEKHKDRTVKEDTYGSAETHMGKPSKINITEYFEFENAISTDQYHLIANRSEASNQTTLRMADETGVKNVELKICLQPNEEAEGVTFFVDDIRYSNDGASDLISLKFQNVDVGNFQTNEIWGGGDAWNVFQSSQGFGPLVKSGKGHYVLTITVKTDIYGVELDRLTVSAINQRPEKDIICGASVYAP